MPYVKRDDQGNIQAISKVKTSDFSEDFSSNHDTLQAILSMLAQKDIEAITSDLEMVRVIEDVIETLIFKSIISLNDLPQPVKDKLLKRKNLRNQGLFNINNNELINL